MTNSKERTALRLTSSGSWSRDHYFTPLKESEVTERIAAGLPIPDSTGGWFAAQAVIWYWDNSKYQTWLAERRKQRDAAELAERENDVRKGIRETVDGPQIGSPAWNEQHPGKSLWGLRR